MTVHELTQDQLDELKDTVFWNFLESPTSDPVFDELTPELLAADFPNEIPNSVIFRVYDGIDFVNDDFYCTAGK